MKRLLIGLTALLAFSASALGQDVRTGPGGTVTSLTAGSGITLTPNPITSSGTIACAPGVAGTPGCVAPAAIGPIGGTTPSSALFTTLGLSGSLTGLGATFSGLVSSTQVNTVTGNYLAQGHDLMFETGAFDASLGVAAAVKWLGTGAGNMPVNNPYLIPSISGGSQVTYSAEGTSATIGITVLPKNNGAITLSTTTAESCLTGLQTNSSGVISCLASAERFKIDEGPLDIADPDALDKLKPVVFGYKDFRLYGGGMKIGLYAEDVCAMDERLCERRDDGQIQAYDVRGVVAYLIADRQQMKAEISELKAANQNTLWHRFERAIGL